MLKRETPGFISPTLLPPNSPDLSPVDYKIWGVLQERVYRVRIHDVDHLKRRLVEEWAQFDQTIIDDASSSGASVFVPVFALRVDILSI